MRGHTDLACLAHSTGLPGKPSSETRLESPHVPGLGAAGLLRAPGLWLGCRAGKLTCQTEAGGKVRLQRKANLFRGKRGPTWLAASRRVSSLLLGRPGVFGSLWDRPAPPPPLGARPGLVAQPLFANAFGGFPGRPFASPVPQRVAPSPREDSREPLLVPPFTKQPPPAFGWLFERCFPDVSASGLLPGGFSSEPSRIHALFANAVSFPPSADLFLPTALVLLLLLPFGVAGCGRCRLAQGSPSLSGAEGSSWPGQNRQAPS